MKIEEAYEQIKKFYHSINHMHPELSYEIVENKKEPFKNWFREEVPALGYSKKSGIYLFSNIAREILYIGKAASDNLGAEIYSKFGAATIIREKDIPHFGNSSMAQWAPDEYKEVIKSGDIYISALSVIPKEFSSLFEVYLHVWCSIGGGLPKLNKRIG